ncbi:hypothetical protein E6O75_ATG03883 [Venturia nashicola]|uniref:Uncharacterized protein n=1 Tax=Venturia nashicola TaxID=86259 RepID=A0A4Z1PQ11_9PEZI|nr:hypothetical protein E6O75_ATG03883 [Venturia nashicola]
MCFGMLRLSGDDDIFDDFIDRNIGYPLSLTVSVNYEKVSQRLTIFDLPSQLTGSAIECMEDKSLELERSKTKSYTILLSMQDRSGLGSPATLNGLGHFRAVAAAESTRRHYILNPRYHGRWMKMRHQRKEISLFMF